MPENVQVAIPATAGTALVVAQAAAGEAKDAEFEVVGPASIGRDHNGGPNLYKSVEEIVAGVKSAFESASGAAEEIEGTLVSKLSIACSDYTLVANIKGGTTLDGHGAIKVDHEKMWKAIRDMLKKSLNSADVEVTPTIMATIPTAVRAGILFANGHVKVARYSRGAGFGDKPTAQGSVQRVCVPYNVAQPTIMGTFQEGKKKVNKEFVNNDDYLTPVTGEIIKMLYAKEIEGAKTKVNGKGRRVIERDAVGAGQGKEQKGPLPADFPEGEAGFEMADAIIERFPQAINMKRAAGKLTVSDILCSIVASEQAVKCLGWQMLKGDKDAHSNLFDLKCVIDTLLDNDGNVIEPK